MRSIFTVLLFLFCTSAFAQSGATDKGVYLFKASFLNGLFGEEGGVVPGGTGAIISLKGGTRLNLGGGAGYFITDNIVLGTDLAFLYDSPDEGDSSSDIIFRPFGRYYFKEKFFAGAGFNLIEDNSHLDIEAGYSYFIDDLIAFEGALHYPVVEDAGIVLSIGISIYY